MVLALEDSEVWARVGLTTINGFVDLTYHPTCGPRYRDRCRRQVASGSAIAGEPKLHRHDSAPDVKGA